MALETKLTHDINQRLILTPQIITSIRLLTMPIAELRVYLEKQMTENPVLEIDTNSDPLTEKEPELDESSQDNLFSEEEIDFKEQFDILNSMDEEWQENFFKNTASSNDPDRKHKRDYRLSLITKPHNLYDHLIEQLVLADLDPKERLVAENIIGNIDEHGYLQASLEEISQTCQTNITKVKKILSVIQNFDPPGVAARDLRETLLIQLRYLKKDNTLAYQIVKNHLDDFNKKKFEKIARKLNVSIEEVNQAKQTICKLEPKPGRLFGEVRPQTITPDIILEKKNGEYVIILNDNEIPRLKINKYYKSLIKKQNLSPETAQFIKEKIKAALGLIKGVAQRQSTIMKITREIVAYQKEFLEKGRDYLKPLTLKEIAQKIGMHESTVSRAIANKYIQTSQGILCMKEFFNNKFKDRNGHYQSQVNVKEKIIELIENENPRSPLTDDDLVKLLSKEGINIARRTVAKYRNAAHILPSTLRKSC